jgi:hypothetical protein
MSDTQFCSNRQSFISQQWELLPNVDYVPGELQKQEQVPFHVGKQFMMAAALATEYPSADALGREVADPDPGLVTGANSLAAPFNLKLGNFLL